MRKLEFGVGKSLTKDEELDGLGCPFQTHLPLEIRGYFKKPNVWPGTEVDLGVHTHTHTGTRTHMSSCACACSQPASLHSQAHRALCVHMASQTFKGRDSTFVEPSRPFPLRAFAPGASRWVIAPPPSPVCLNSWINQQAS